MLQTDVMACNTEDINCTDEEKNDSHAIPIQQLPPTPPVLPHPGIVYYPMENAQSAPLQFRVPPVNQSNLTPTVEPFCPSLQVYLPSPAFHNQAQPIPGAHSVPDMMAPDMQHCEGVYPQETQPIHGLQYDLQPITASARRETPSLTNIHDNIQPIPDLRCQSSQTMTEIGPIRAVQCLSVTSVNTEVGPAQAQERMIELERRLKEAARELTFLGDRNWRMEAYIDCLVHTLRKMDVTTVIDLNQKMLPLSLFHVKAKAGFQLGSFNQLPRRSVWHYSRDGKQPPNIDLSGTHVVKGHPIIKTELMKELEANNLLPLEGDDIGLSVDQLFEYESRVMGLERETYSLRERLQTASDKESILMERLRTSQQTANYLEEELNNKCEELNQARFHIARLEQQHFRRHPRNPNFPGRFRARHRHPFNRPPPFPYPPPQHPMQFPPPPPMMTAIPLPPPIFEDDIQQQQPTVVTTFEDAEQAAAEAAAEATVVSNMPPSQPVYFMAPPYPLLQPQPGMIEELISIEGGIHELPIAAEAPENHGDSCSTTNVPPVHNVPSS